MNLSKKGSYIVIGLALFSMFFGSGNLIYPLFVGVSSSTLWIKSSLAFLLTAVFLPFLGVIAMVLFKGDYQSFFSILGGKLGFLFSMFLLTIWIPLGSAPRCIALAYSSISKYVNIGPIWIFSLIYSFLVFYVINRKENFLDILGKIITPLLIGSILVIFSVGLKSHPQIPANSSLSFFSSLKEGYNTMDLIASFFFSASVIHILYKKSKSMPSSIKMIVKSSIIGIFLLAFVYVILIYTSSKYSSSLINVKKDQLLASLALIILGPKFSIISLIAIVLACFSTSVALVIAYSDFLQMQVFKNKQDINFSIIFSIFISFVMSLFGLNGISFITAPILKICYPILLGLIIINITKAFISEKKLIKIKKTSC